jgi:hypothetical protein
VISLVTEVQTSTSGWGSCAVREVPHLLETFRNVLPFLFILRNLGKINNCIKMQININGN